MTYSCKNRCCTSMKLCSTCTEIESSLQNSFKIHSANGNFDTRWLYIINTLNPYIGWNNLSQCFTESSTNILERVRNSSLLREVETWNYSTARLSESPSCTESLCARYISLANYQRTASSKHLTKLSREFASKVIPRCIFFGSVFLRCSLFPFFLHSLDTISLNLNGVH